MARAITKYQAKDGSEWWAESYAEARDMLADAVVQALLPLGPEVVDRGCEFVNGGGYVQHETGNVLEAKRRLIAIARTEIKHSVWDHPAEDIHPMSLAGRLIDDSGIAVLQVAWNRIARIDNDSREWGQVYYALNPTKGTQREWPTGKSTPPAAPGPGR